MRRPCPGRPLGDAGDAIDLPASSYALVEVSSTIMEAGGTRAGASTVTGTLLDLIRQGKVATDRLLRENASLRAELVRLTDENADLRARLGEGRGGTPA